MESPREPHSISLKVLRLSKPSLSQIVSLPKHPQGTIPQVTSRAIPNPASDEIDSQFILNPLLTLPPSFGAAYVGETFACTLCANNELDETSEKIVTAVKLTAEMQAPSLKLPLELTPLNGDPASPIPPGKPLQKIVRFELTDEGNHVLAVSVTYSETTMTRGKSASSGRVRTFRKLYQFVAEPCLNVKTKVSEIAPKFGAELPKAYNAHSYALEAQLENMAGAPITLEKVILNPKFPFEARSINWDAFQPESGGVESPVLKPRDVMQVAFLVNRQVPENSDDVAGESIKEGRIILGQMNIQWRTAMGDSGFLTTGWLMTKRR